MDRLQLLNKRQDEAIEAWVSRSYRAIVLAAVGFGKTMVFFKAMQRLIDDKVIKPNSTVWYLAETTVREKTLNDERRIYERLFGKLNLKIEFYCYQAKPKGSPAAIGADEIHDALTPMYHEVLKNVCPIIGITATLPNSRVSKIEGSPYYNIRKIDLANTLNLPVVFNYTLERGIEEGILSPYEIIIVPHTLDNTKQVYRTNKGMKTELQNYNSKIRAVNYLKREGNWGAAQGLERKLYKTLYDLPSKSLSVKELLSKTGKTLLFATSIDFLLGITEHTVCSRNTAKVNTAIIDDYNADKIDLIGSFNMLKQGITLKGVTDVIIASYYSKPHILIQQLGRAVRFVKGKKANVYIYLTESTVEERWITAMLPNVDISKLPRYER